MRSKGTLPIFFILITGLFLIVSCKPINIFSPLIDPSKMGADANLDAGYNALSDENYEDAIDYFSNVIESSATDDEKSDAYLGRASAYLHEAAPNLDNVVEDLIDGNTDADGTGDIIDTAIGDGSYNDFFNNAQNAADDYNDATEITGDDTDPGVLLEAYQSNMMAATGVGAQTIAIGYVTPPWDGVTKTLNEELDAICDSDSTYTYNVGTWGSSSAPNGLSSFVDEEASETQMMVYLTNAFNALTQLEESNQEVISSDDIINMKDGINEWVIYGLGETLLS